MPIRNNGNIITGEGVTTTPPRPRRHVREARNPLDVGAEPLPASEMYKSMSVTKNSTDAIISTATRSFLPRESMVVRDIRGAVPKGLPAHTRAVYHDPGDIAGAAPHQLHRAAAGHFDGLAVDDIDGARPRPFDFRTTRLVNPLEPVYPLPSAPTRPFTPVEHKRDLWLPDDIAGTKPCAHLPWQPRESLKIDDIAGTRSIRSVKEARGHHDILDVRDINTDGQFHTKRNTNPLEPSYAIHGLEITDSIHVHSKAPPKQRGADFLPLVTDDIDGAQPMTWERKKVGTVRMGERRAFRDLHAVTDVVGAQASTRRRGLASTRVVDPNQRDYTLLDGRKMGAEDMLVGQSRANALRSVMARDAALQAASVAAPPMLPGYPADDLSASMRYSMRKLDPRDAEIASLRAQVTAARAAPRAEPVVAASVDAPARLSATAPAAALSSLVDAPPVADDAFPAPPVAVPAPAPAAVVDAPAPSAVSAAVPSAVGSKANSSGAAAKKSHARVSSSAAFAATTASASRAMLESLGPRYGGNQSRPDVFRVRQVDRERTAEVAAVRGLV